METKRYLVREGRASWHQQRAGHIYAASGTHRFTPEELATFISNYRKNNPYEPLDIQEIEETK